MKSEAGSGTGSQETGDSAKGGMRSGPGRRPWRRGAALGGIGLASGGLAPLITGLVGVHGYLTRGYFISKTGTRIDGSLGWGVSGLLVLAGLAMIADGVRRWVKSRRPEPGP